MPRRPRFFVANVPYHVIQRGNNKDVIFRNNGDYLFFLSILKEAKLKYPCFMYSYCLMPNHFHLLIQPSEKDNISFLMKFLGDKYVFYINKKYNRSGTLWEGRFRSSLIDREQYFLACLRYIEMNPVRACLVKAPELYRWSSYRFRAFGEKNHILDLDQWYISLGENSTKQQMNYRRFINDSVLESKIEVIREMTQRGGIAGSDKFKNEIEKILGKKIIIRLPGRPSKTGSDPVFGATSV